VNAWTALDRKSYSAIETPEAPVIPAESIDDPLIGHVVAGRYTVLEHIGDGGVGIVYKARQEPIGRLVALKMLLSDATNDRNVERFLREARIISSLRHPNTVTLIDFGQAADGRLFIAMELLTGGELRDLMKGGRVALVPALRVARQIASSLAEAHAADIWHRDLKPENVLFDEVEGEALVVRVVDFGMAKLHEPDNDIMLTAPGTRMGTPEYMSPQQAFAKPLDHRTDLYSLGVILYEMLTGHLPFSSDSTMGMYLEHAHTPPRPISEFAPDLDIDPELDALVLQMLAKEEAGRPPSALDVVAVIDRVLAKHTADAEVPITSEAPPPAAPVSDEAELEEMARATTRLSPALSAAIAVVVTAIAMFLLMR